MELRIVKKTKTNGLNQEKTTWHIEELKTYTKGFFWNKKEVKEWIDYRISSVFHHMNYVYYGKTIHTFYSEEKAIEIKNHILHATKTISYNGKEYNVSLLNRDLSLIYILNGSYIQADNYLLFDVYSDEVEKIKNIIDAMNEERRKNEVIKVTTEVVG